ncbi:hypothetical protein GOODEAATRI_005228, partial [Goodea atripinnis]
NMMQMCSCHFQHSLRPGCFGLSLKDSFFKHKKKDTPIKVHVLQVSEGREKPSSTPVLTLLCRSKQDSTHGLESCVTSTWTTEGIKDPAAQNERENFVGKMLPVLLCNFRFIVSSLADHWESIFLTAAIQ